MPDALTSFMRRMQFSRVWGTRNTRSQYHAASLPFVRSYIASDHPPQIAMAQQNNAPPERVTRTTKPAREGMGCTVEPLRLYTNSHQRLSALFPGPQPNVKGTGIS